MGVKGHCPHVVSRCLRSARLVTVDAARDPGRGGACLVSTGTFLPHPVPCPPPSLEGRPCVALGERRGELSVNCPPLSGILQGHRFICPLSQSVITYQRGMPGYLSHTVGYSATALYFIALVVPGPPWGIPAAPVSL